MPIRPENLDRYPANWPEIRGQTLELAGHRCEICGVANHAWGYRDEKGVFHRVSKRPLIEAFPRDERVRPPFYLETVKGRIKIIEIVLTVAHLDHVPEHCDPSNLKALCQKCHLAYDAEHHAQTAYATRREGRALADLFA